MYIIYIDSAAVEATRRGSLRLAQLLTILGCLHHAFTISTTIYAFHMFTLPKHRCLSIVSTLWSVCRLIICAVGNRKSVALRAHSACPGEMLDYVTNILPSQAAQDGVGQQVHLSAHRQRASAVEAREMYKARTGHDPARH